MSVVPRAVFVAVYQSLSASQDIEAASKKHGICYNTVLSIYAQKKQKQAKLKVPQYRNGSQLFALHRRYCNGETLLSIAASIDLSPCLFARLMLSHILRTNPSILAAVRGAPNNRENDEPAEKELSPNAGGDQRGKQNVPTPIDVKRVWKNPWLIPDERLIREVVACVDADDAYSPLAERVRHSIGLEYEFRLQERLRNLGIRFYSEEKLRQEGVTKTPDVKLLVPIIADGQLVNWIESKALFGDEDTHASYFEAQLSKYRHRFGPGMVIYWFGFVEELRQRRDDGLLIIERLPANIELLRIADV